MGIFGMPGKPDKPELALHQDFNTVDMVVFEKLLRAVNDPKKFQDHIEHLSKILNEDMIAKTKINHEASNALLQTLADAFTASIKTEPATGTAIISGFTGFMAILMMSMKRADLLVGFLEACKIVMYQTASLNLS